MKQVWIIGLALLMGQSGMAQRVLLEEEPPDFSSRTYGMNRKHFGMIVLRYGAGVGSDRTELTAPEFALSNHIAAGARYKRKLAKPIALNIDVAYEFQKYFLNEERVAEFPNPIEIPDWPRSLDLERLRIFNHAIELAPSLRFTVGKGNDIGLYLDAGVFAQYVWEDALLYEGKSGDDEVSYRYRQFHPDERINYGFLARFGYAYTNLYFRYRPIDMYESIGVPTYFLGIEFNLY